MKERRAKYVQAFHGVNVSEEVPTDKLENRGGRQVYGNAFFSSTEPSRFRCTNVMTTK